jgi:Methyltransferase domain/Predicted methyltransferase regulatory domain
LRQLRRNWAIAARLDAKPCKAACKCCRSDALRMATGCAPGGPISNRVLPKRISTSRKRAPLAAANPAAPKHDAADPIPIAIQHCLPANARLTRYHLPLAMRRRELNLPTSYDRVAYPTSVFIQTHPERLAVLARLAGLDPVDPRQARIMEIGGGDCVNLLSFAAMWPDCTAHGFDLSEVAIARGEAIRAVAGLDNAALRVADIMTAHQHYPAKSFDYIIVHGVYAWVPPPVRAACMALVAHLLSDRGVAMISYNCMPGGHVRLIMREMLLNAIGNIDGFDERIAAARSFLEDYARPGEDDDPLATTLRQQAESMLRRPDSVLFHDELGEAYHPQQLGDVVQDAAAAGLRVLTDAGRNRHLDGFLPDHALPGDDVDAAVVKSAIAQDYVDLRYFRHSLFVRKEAQLDRSIDVNRMKGLYLATRLERGEDGSFSQGMDEIVISDPALADAIANASVRSPQRTPLADIATTPEQLRVVLQLFNEWYVALYLHPAPFPAAVGDYPRTSPLVRALLSTGELTICSLDHALLKIEQAELRALLMAADGTTSIADIAASGHGIPPEEVDAALNAAAQRALIAN